MIFSETTLKGAFIIEPELMEDERGFFARSWCRKEFEEHGLNSNLVQCNISFNKRKGTLRGMHYQLPPFEETKLVRCTRGSVYDVIIDLRPYSDTYKQWMSVELTAENRKMLYVPEGFAHGFQTLEDNTEVFYQMSEYYHPECARGIRWDDKALKIEWLVKEKIISEKDMSYPEVDEYRYCLPLKKNKIVFWGATGQAKVLKEIIAYQKGFNLEALFDNNINLASPFVGIPLYYGKSGFEEWIKEYKNEVVYFAVAIGGDKGKERLKIQKYLQAHGLVPVTLIHPGASIASNATIGNGVQILANSCISVETKVGDGCIVNTSASIDHECILEEGVHICPGAHIAGCVKVGRCSTIGTGATILPRLVIGEGAVVGAGAVVIKDVPDYAVVVGNPAKIIKYNERLRNS